MAPLIAEILLRLAKVVAALVLGLVVWLVAVGPLGQPPSAELALLSWLSGASFVVLVETSPI
ncbi:MAG TPA: hypothetical protein VH720_09290 [Candidatus Limnocylindrales bacterium]|jgi:hypothetical protein